MLATSVALTPRQEAKATLLERILSGHVKCGVIGLGFIGSVLMDALSHTGLRVSGYDRQHSSVERFERWMSSRAESTTWSASGNESEILNGDVVFIAVRLAVNNGVPDDEPLQSAVKLLRRHAVRPRLIVVESTVLPGTTRRVAADLGLALDAGTFVVHAPERLSAGHDRTTFRKIPHLVGGVDPESTAVGAALLERTCDTVVRVPSPEVSELSKLLENCFLSVNIGLINEITRIAHHLDVNALDVCMAAATKTSGYMPFYPGAGVGGHCLPNDLALLTHFAQTSGWRPELLSGTVAVNNHAPEMAVDALERILAREYTPLRGARVLVVGVGFKPGSPDTSLSPAFDVIRTLNQRGAEPMFSDAAITQFAVDGVMVPACAPAELKRMNIAAAILLSGDSRLSADDLLASCGLVLDTMTRGRPTTDSPRWHVL